MQETFCSNRALTELVGLLYWLGSKFALKCIKFNVFTCVFVLNKVSSEKRPLKKFRSLGNLIFELD